MNTTLSRVLASVEASSDISYHYVVIEYHWHQWWYRSIIQHRGVLKNIVTPCGAWGYPVERGGALWSGGCPVKRGGALWSVGCPGGGGGGCPVKRGGAPWSSTDSDNL